MECPECFRTRHMPMLGICGTYDAQVASLAAESLAERELLTDCHLCGAQLVRWANNPTKYEFDRQTVHACVVQQPVATRPRLLPPVQRPPQQPVAAGIRALD